MTIGVLTYILTKSDKVICMTNGKAIIIVLLTVLNCGCAKQVIDINASHIHDLGKDKNMSSKDITNHFFFADIDVGLNDKIDAASICNGVENVVRVETKVGFLDSLLSGVTGGFYTPRSARVYCAV